MEFGDILLRLGVTFVLAFIFGIERQKSHKPVGFGTFIFVSIGSCALSIIALDLGADNPLPLLGAIVTGVGFLGAGALIKTSSDKILGFTTAAGIWLFAILGILIGVGYFQESIVVYVLLWICILTDRQLDEGKLVKYQKRLEIKLNAIEKENEITNLFDKFNISKYKLISKKIDKKDKTVYVNYLIEGWGKDIRDLVSEIEQQSYFVEFSLG